MTIPFSDRISDVPRSFIREILKVAIDPQIISFAGGLPNRNFFPVEALQNASNKVFETAGREALQYANSEGDLILREMIASRYKEKKGLDIKVDNILITSGSQQGLDLMGKILLNDGDGVVIEEPGYLGAIQAFSVYRASFHPVPISEEGMDTERLQSILQQKKPRILYTVPNFQNPSGITYSEAGRDALAAVLERSDTLLIEDDPYGELRFTGKDKTSFAKRLPDQTVMLGSFSKIVAPGLRIGWIVAPDLIMEKLIVAKQASDLHTQYLGQLIIRQFLQDNDLDGHISTITDVYNQQRLAMIRGVEQYFPEGVQFTRPEGGMFLWMTLPSDLSAMSLFHRAIDKKVAFVPGDPFYASRKHVSTLRLNFSCVDKAGIDTGMARLGGAVREAMEQR
ncbi:PLP-dependent aminotransferase family protein [Desulfobotulus sp. H1]|uniref:PLP-dependent aminotransferase family protein n=1 Tax=Desulfobotulus pelophilus TaxID=2823377 RepID=A0ABT3NA70_9BACT|nr:PLP-dependent aminotransferase family protein [Desulfobotulus pelophilus]MCW7754356.1 PLP-dependent aminotransferase family protein [Desulfobotulus pelophilus]